MTHSTPSIKLNLDDFIRFNHELESLARSRLPLAAGLRNLGRELRNSSRLKELAEITAARIEQGHSLSEAVESAALPYSKAYLQLIRLGEKAGSLDAILAAVVRASRRELEMRSAIRTMLIYPVVILVFALGVITLIHSFFIPRFMTLLQQLSVELPPASRFLLDLSSSGWVASLPFLALAAAAALGQSHRIPWARALMDRMILYVPMIGPLAAFYAVSQWCHAMALLLRGGVALDEALEFAATASNHSVLSRISLESAAMVRRGGRMTEPLRNGLLFTPSFVWMLSRGEERGDLPETFAELAELAEARLVFLRQKALVFFEPLLILLLGVFIGSLVLGVFIPFFSLPRVLGMNF